MIRLPLAFSILLLLTACTSSRRALEGDRWTLHPIVKLDQHNPILGPERGSTFEDPVRNERVRWEERHVYNPAAVVRDNQVWLLYRAQDDNGTSRIGLAKSRDGLSFRRNDKPVLYPSNDPMRTFEWPGGCEDPRIVRRDDGLYIMTYTAYDGKMARLSIASSRDLENWTKHGLVLIDSEYRDTWSKSGAIVAELKRGEIVARKIDGKYWMYFGDTNLFMATSDDLIAWTPVESKKGKLEVVMEPRKDYFDSKLVEPGPFALFTKDGILLLYNSANDAKRGNKDLADGSYAVGQALFSKKDPTDILARSNRYFLYPEREYELTGLVNNVTFLEGMVWFKDRWLLYYGTADSKIAVAEVR